MAYDNRNFYGSNFQAILSQEEKSILSQYQLGDELLYKEFKSRLLKKVEEYGKERMEMVRFNIIKHIYTLSIL